MDRDGCDEASFDGEFARAAALHPGEAAVLYDVGGRLRAMTYRQLDEYSRRVAGMLTRRGVGFGCRVPLLLERGFDAVAMALGVVRAGAAFTFLSPDIPPDRLRYMLEDLGSGVVLRHSKFDMRFPDGVLTIDVDKVDWRGETDAATARQNRPDDHLAVFYTSGTTGTPKGVVLTHRNLLAFSRADIAARGLRSGSRTLAQAEMTFDAFLWNIFPPLLAAARVYVMDATSRLSLAATHDFMLRHRIEHAFLTTRLAEEYIRAFDNPHLKILVTGGEKMRPVRLRNYAVWNYYGPTETAVAVTKHVVVDGETDVPIGFPLGENRIIFIGADGRVCGDGEEGELCVSGPQTSPGYLNLPEFTAEKFVANPSFDPLVDADCYARMYRTGDLGVRLPSGEIAYRGRIDRMLKIRGHRIQPEEVEIALRLHPSVTEAVVVARDDAGEDPVLVAYYVGKTGVECAQGGALRDYLEERLPGYMIPSFFVSVPEIPLRPNGKVDAARLPPPA